MKSKLMQKKVLIVLALALLAAVGGWFLAGMGSSPQAKLPVEPIHMKEPFVVNLRDDGGTHFIKINVAVRLAPMTTEEHELFESGGEGGGHGGGSAESTGPAKVADNADLKKAVVSATRRFSREELLAEDGMERLEAAILAEMQTAMRAITPVVPKGADKPPHNPAHAPYEIEEVLVTGMPVR